MTALSHTPDCLGQAVTKSACPGWSSGPEGFASWWQEVEDPAEGMLLAGLTCKVDVSALRLARHQSLLCSRISNSNCIFHSPTRGALDTLDSHPWFSVSLSSVSANGFEAVTCSLGLQSSTELTLGPLENRITSEPMQ